VSGPVLFAKFDQITHKLLQCDAAEAECDRLHERLRRLSLDDLSAVEGQGYAKPDEIPFPTQDSMLESMIRGIKIQNPEKEGLYLSPLPEIETLPSSLKSFVALPEVDYESDKPKNVSPVKDSIAPIADLVHAVPEHPIPINTTPPMSNPHAPKVSSGLSLTAPRGPSVCDQDMQTRSRSSSLFSTRDSSPSPYASKSAAPSRQPIAIRDTYSRDRGRSMVLGPNEPEKLRSQLYDLLSNPVSSSMPNISHFPSKNAIPAPASPLSPHPPSSVSQHATAYPNGGPYAPVAVSPPPVPQSHSPHKPAAPQRSVISHASSAAMALEKERQKADMERQKAAENERQNEDQRRKLTAGASSNSLRDHSITYLPPTGKNIPAKREPVHIYAMTTVTGSSSSLRDSTKAQSLSRGSSNSLRDTPSAYAAQQVRQQGVGNGKGRLSSVQTLFT
jgi:hypothetical protein